MWIKSEINKKQNTQKLFVNSEVSRGFIVVKNATQT